MFMTRRGNKSRLVDKEAAATAGGLLPRRCVVLPLPPWLPGGAAVQHRLGPDSCAT